MSTNNKTMNKQFCDNIKNNIDNLYNIYKEDNWMWDYDEVSDILYFCNKEKGYSEKSISMPINDDYLTVQINQSGNIEGITIEDFVKLFVPENMEYYEFAQNLTKKQKIKKKDEEIVSNSAKGFCKMIATDMRSKNLFTAEKCCAPV